MAHLKKISGILTNVRPMRNNVYEYTLTDKHNKISKYISYCRRSISHQVTLGYEQKTHHIYGEQNQLRTIEYDQIIRDKDLIQLILVQVVKLASYTSSKLIKTYVGNFFELLLKD